MFRRLACLAGVVIGVAGLAATADAQVSRCADCHFARPDSPGQNHVFEWDRSLHRRNDVGCESCHGGDASTFESFLAHRDIVPPGLPDSPVSRQNLPRTCGACHAGPFVAFQSSQHYQLLQNGDRDGPTCTTCHGNAAARTLSAKALEGRCGSCHGPGEVAPRAERAQAARVLYEEIAVVRDQLELADSLIRRVDDPARRATLVEAYGQAEVPLIQAIEAGHRFVYDQLNERLGVARTRTGALLARLANPPDSR